MDTTMDIGTGIIQVTDTTMVGIIMVEIIRMARAGRWAEIHTPLQMEATSEVPGLVLMAGERVPGPQALAQVGPTVI